MAEGKKAEELSANQKIALVLAAMGADNASAVYKHLSDDEIEALSTEVAKLEYQPIDVVEGVLNEFYELCLTQKVVTEGGVDYAREILEKAFGTEAANNLLQRITKQLKTKSFDFSFSRRYAWRSSVLALSVSAFTDTSSTYFTM